MAAASTNKFAAFLSFSVISSFTMGVLNVSVPWRLVLIMSHLAAIVTAISIQTQAVIQCDNHNSNDISINRTTPANASLPSASACFPGLGFEMPAKTPASLDGWWCDAQTEYAFLGFSYEISACQSLSQLTREFKDIRNRFNGRYIRLYGACDKANYYDNVVAAAWSAGLGVHALVWFGFDGDDIWKTRRDNLFRTLKNNPRAKYVTRVVQFGSEPLFDYVLTPNDLAAQVKAAKKTLAPLKIPVTVSELAYGYQVHGGAQNVLDALDSINIHILPFFAQDATTGGQAWKNVKNDITWFIKHGKGKKMYLDENGWPSTSYQGVQPNSPNAVTNIYEERDYFKLIDSKCEYFKILAQGGVAWFAHLYNDDQEPGYGILHTRARGAEPKFYFEPRTHC